MKRYMNPPKDSWFKLAQRPTLNLDNLKQKIESILSDIKVKGDEALHSYSQLFDKAELNEFLVSQEEIKKACKEVSYNLKTAIQQAAKNIKAFHSSQLRPENKTMVTEGIQCWRKSVAIQKVGLYIPGGSAPLFSTILMLGIPAKLVGCDEIIICTPPNKNGLVDASILFTAKFLGITKIYKIGGAQAIAAMSYGTESIPAVNKIFGPGNQYVTLAKQLVQQQGTAIDMPAGPSEVLIVADETGVPEFIAADLLSQAEHGPDSQVILVSNDLTILNQSLKEINKQLEVLPRKAIATKALSNSKAILFDNIHDCISFSNTYAPEHLIIASKNAQNLEDSIVNAGSVFIGNYSCEAAGDYASGTNHTLPTNGYAKQYSGVSTDSFVKKITFQHIDKKGLHSIGETIEIMATAEGLIGHKNAVTLRLKK